MQKHTRYLVAGFFAFLLTACAGKPAMAQQVISGTVLDAVTEAPLASANVSIVNTALGTSTDGEGRFSLEVDALPVTLSVRFVGYIPMRIQVETGDPVTLRLQPEEILLEDLVVVGSRLDPRTVIDSPVPVDNIKAADLLATGQGAGNAE